MFVVRYVVPALLCVVGLVILVAGGFSAIAVEGWALLTGAGVTVLLLSLLFRLGVEGDRDRDREEAAREYFDRHGHWPSERPRS